MARKYSFKIIEKAYAVLSAHPEQRMTARDIAYGIIHTFPEDCQKKRTRSKIDYSDEEFTQQLIAEIGSSWRTLVDRFDDLRTVETRPGNFIQHD